MHDIIFLKFESKISYTYSFSPIGIGLGGIPQSIMSPTAIFSTEPYVKLGHVCAEHYVSNRTYRMLLSINTLGV